MVQFIIPALIVLAAIIVITIIVIRHIPQAAAIDIDALPAEQEAAMKAALMERRLKRKIHGFKNKLIPFFRKFARLFVKLWDRLHKKVSSMEQKYRQKPHTMTSGKQAEVKQKIKALLDQAEKFENDENFSEAEAKYIEILSWDHKNLEAYVGLGKVYCEQKEYKQAKETYSYLLKIVTGGSDSEDSQSKFSSPLNDSQINEVYFDYVVCLQRTDMLDKAVSQLEVLLDRDPKNPKYLDKAVEVNILLKDSSAARTAFSALKNVNPENQKLATLEEEIRNI